MRLLVVNSHPRLNSRELICAVLACFEGELKMKKVLAILFFLFVLATATAYGFPLLSYDHGSHQGSNYSSITYSLESAATRTAAARDGKVLVIARSDGDSENQHKQGHNHDHKAKSKYDLRDIDGKHGGDSHKHVHEHGHNHDHKAKSKYDLRDIDGHKHGEDHHHHGEGHDHHHGEAHEHGHGHGHDHHHGEAHGHDHGETHDHGHGEGHEHGHEHGHGHDGDEGGHHHDEEGPEGLYDRLWDVVTLG